MATSLLNQTSTRDKTMKGLCGSKEAKTESSRKRGRRTNGKDPIQKKPPQRGLGVAQLERLRLQESWKKMNGASSLPPLPDQHHRLFQSRTLLLPFAINDPFACVPVRYVAAANHGAPHDPPSVINGQTVGYRSGFNVVGGWLMPNQVWSPLVGSLLENSKELSSIPNVHSESKRFDVCIKNKRFNEDSDFTARATRHAAASYATCYLDEVAAVHRKKNSMNGRHFMEYEFFPGKDGRGTTSEELELPTVASVAVDGEDAPSITATSYENTASNSIDLSLKLSY